MLILHTYTGSVWNITGEKFAQTLLWLLHLAGVFLLSLALSTIRSQNLLKNETQNNKKNMFGSSHHVCRALPNTIARLFTLSKSKFE
jgi:hypothetical protein